MKNVTGLQTRKGPFILLANQLFLILLGFIMFFYLDGCNIVSSSGPNPCSSTNPCYGGPVSTHDIGAPDLSVKLNYAQKMDVNQAYMVIITLTSQSGNTSLLNVNGTTHDRQSSLLQDILGQNNTACVDSFLQVDTTSFSVSSQNEQEVPLAQTSVTWKWQVTPLQAAEGLQTIPLTVMLVGKSHCGSGDPITGPYYLSNIPDLTIQVIDPNDTPLNRVMSSPLFVGIITALVGLIVAFIGWFTARLWTNTRRRLTIRAKEDAEAIKAKAIEEANIIRRKATEEAETIRKNASRKKARRS